MRDIPLGLVRLGSRRSPPLFGETLLLLDDALAACGALFGVLHGPRAAHDLCHPVRGLGQGGGRPEAAIYQGGGMMTLGVAGSVKSESGTVVETFVASIDHVAPWTVNWEKRVMPSRV